MIGIYIAARYIVDNQSSLHRDSVCALYNSHYRRILGHLDVSFVGFDGFIS